MTTHPYPHKVVEAVARALLKSGETRGAFGDGGDWDATGYVIRSEFMEHANTALTALWEASRVDTKDQLDSLPDHSFIVDESGCCISEIPDDFNVGYLPAHVLYWGDRT